MDQVDNFVCRNSIQEPSLLFWHCVTGCFGHACVVRLLHTVIGGLIITPTEEIGILVMVTNKWGQVCPVDSLHQAHGADIYLQNGHLLSGIGPAEKPQALGIDIVALLSLSGRETSTPRSSCLPQDFWAFPNVRVRVPLYKQHFILFKCELETFRVGIVLLWWIPWFPPSSI